MNTNSIWAPVEKSLGFLIVCALVFIAGCAHLTFRSVKDTDPIKGVRYYRPAPYLLVGAGAQGGCDAKVIWLPNLDQQVELKTWWFGIGTVSEKPTLTDGWNLTGLDTTVDTKFPDTINSLVGAANAASAMAAAPGGENLPPGGFWAQDPRDQQLKITGLGFYKINLNLPRVGGHPG